MPYEIMLILSTLPPLAVVGGAGYLALRFIRAFERRGASQKELSDLHEKFAQLESTVENMQRDVGRITDEQDFTTRLLAERHDKAL